MGRIIGYQYDNDIKDDDAWIGTEATSRRTKQYTAQAVADYLNINGSISIVGQMSYKYSTTPLNGIGTFAVFGGGPNTVAFSAITKLTLSNQDISEQRVVEYLDLLVGSDMIISESGQISTFGYYSIDGYVVNATNSDYYDLSVTFKSGNGAMEADKVYETQNFTLAAEENISTLQTTIDSGNTYQASPSGPLWTWGSGEITTTSTSFTSLLSGKRFKTTLIADGSYTDVIPNQINFNTATGNVTSITTNTALSSNIDLQLPSSSGTLALTSDITDSPWDTVSEGINYAGGNVGIGATTPIHKLEVAGGNVHFENEEGSNTFLDVKGVDANAYIRAYSGSQSLWLYQGGSSSYLQAQTGSTLRLGSGTSNLVITNTSGEIMRISGGNVGIGTTNPSEDLDVAGTIRGEAVFIKNIGGYNAKLLSDSLTTNKTFEFPDANGTIALTSDIPAASQWDNVTGGINYANGNVGIGTTSPSEKLDILNGNLNISAGYYLKSGVRTSILLDRGSDARMVFSTLYQGATTGGYEFSTGYSGVKFLIQGDGNVGIGTTSPVSKLQVQGDIRTNTQVIFTGAGNIVNSSNNLNVNSVNNLLFSIGGYEKMRITSAGNVGIGTTSPSTKLEVISAANEEGIAIKDSSGNLKYKIRQFGGNSYSTFWDSTNTEKVRITSGGSSFFNGGNVGIGTTAPEEKLHVAGGDVLISNGQYYTAKSNTGANYKLAAITTGNQVAIGAIDYTSAGTIFAGGDNVSITTGGVAGSSRLKILSNGNVGIGTTSPLGNLDVTGNNPTLFLVDSGGAANSKRRFLQSNSHKLYFGRQDDIGGSTVYDMLIDANGKVGIGTTSPTSRLDVAGGDIELDDVAAGIIMKSPDGTKYRITVANGGTLTVTAV